MKFLSSLSIVVFIKNSLTIVFKSSRKWLFLSCCCWTFKKKQNKSHNELSRYNALYVIHLYFYFKAFSRKIMSYHSKSEQVSAELKMLTVYFLSLSFCYFSIIIPLATFPLWAGRPSAKSSIFSLSVGTFSGVCPIDIWLFLMAPRGVGKLRWC